ncbi:MAG TPA: heparinase II/III family protein, partial [Pyrinomonadaceae bacterium]|nr:heparinase II/III family protein [Pyrinomonadaceae bacterium]
VAEHYGYKRLRSPVTHRRAVRFDKRERLWLVEDSFNGEGEHTFHLRFHFAEKVETRLFSQRVVLACHNTTGARVFICALDIEDAPTLETIFTSGDYGSKSASIAACWIWRATVPQTFRWAIIPACAGESDDRRLSLVAGLTKSDYVTAERRAGEKKHPS